MIILITGASHAGKTVLAQRMLEKYKYPYLSIDHLKMGLIRSGNTGLTPADDDELTVYLWPIVREMIKTAVENRQNLIVEGCYVPFDWRKDFDERYLSSIRFVCLAMTDAYIDAHFDEIKKHASDIEKRLDDTGLTAEGLKRDNRFVEEGFLKNGEPVTLIEDDYEKTVAALLEGQSDNMIETKRLKIYPASSAQMKSFIAAERNEELKAAYTEMLEGSLAHPDQREWYAIWMIERKNGTHIGDLCFKGLLNGVAEIGYGISEEYQNQGYATEAVGAAVKWALKQSGVKQIEAETEPDNNASRRVLEKCGFIPTGTIGEEGPRFMKGGILNENT